ncbi:MAG TPA: carbon-nitrogen hydrolase family protein [Streptosporangiaceae bacterium]|nr:carbon-nitrogen hydrolase family protein [Streptosporangiaceae bacterium]
MPVLTVATCQFPVSADIRANLGYITRQMRAARRRGADVAHFPEAALSGYAGCDFESFDGFDWAALAEATDDVLDCARATGLWVIVGSAHRLTGSARPHNCLYVISSDGVLADRYDKRFCAGDADGTSGDLAHYSPGDHLSVWTINTVRCGALICYDYRFPELYREYLRQGVQLMFHSFHAARMSAGRVKAIGAAIGPHLAALNPAATFTYPGITMPATMTAAAAANYMWISCPNSSAPQSCWPAFMVRADGITVGRLRRNVPGILVTTVDTEAELYDSTAAWRGRALAGRLHSGTVPQDPRSANRTAT